MGEKGLAEAYILGIPFGLFGAHHFYLGRRFFGILYACTLGLLGLGYLFDLVRMRWLVRHVNRYGTDKKMVTDGYLICALGGLFGAHQFYLGHKKLGIFYACTLGVFTVGWIVDLVRMRHLVRDHNERREEKSLGTAYILGLSPFGIFGAYHYYLGDIKLGLIYTFTFGIFGIGWVVDLFRMKKLVRKAGMDKKSVGTAYIMAFPPFGLFGAYHYYLGNYALGILYTCSLGIFGIGWVVDLFRMKGLVKAANDPTSDHGMTKITAYTLCVSPLGLFGAHHFYLARYLNGGLYVGTLGMFGVGWIFDMLRLPVLYERYADEDKHKYPDDAYLFWFPFGLFGLHQFYLERKRWGILYLCTLGCLGIGWLIDGFRLPVMLKDFNNGIPDPDMNDFRICRPSCKSCTRRKLKRRCLGMCSACACCKSFTLPGSSSTKREGAADANSNHVRDDFDVIKDMYPEENHENYAREMAARSATPDPAGDGTQQVAVAVVQENFDAYTHGHVPGSDPGPTGPGYDIGAFPGEPGSDEYNQNFGDSGKSPEHNSVNNPVYSVEQEAGSQNDDQCTQQYDKTAQQYDQSAHEYDQNAQYDQNGQYDQNAEHYDQNGVPYDQNAYTTDYDQNAHPDQQATDTNAYDQNAYYQEHYDENAQAQDEYPEQYDQNAYDQNAGEQSAYDQSAYTAEEHAGYAQEGEYNENQGVRNPEDVTVTVGQGQGHTQYSAADANVSSDDVKL